MKGHGLITRSMGKMDLQCIKIVQVIKENSRMTASMVKVFILGFKDMNTKGNLKTA
jgi:hypothetical protein